MKTSSHTAAEITDCARRLEDLVNGASAFFDERLASLRELGTSMAEMIPETLDANSEPAESQWKQHMAAEQRRIDEQLDHLTKSWQELESEQRRLSMQGQSSDSSVVEVSGDASRANQQVQRTVVESEEAQPRGDSPTSAAKQSSGGSLDLIDAASMHNMATAAIQFQKLKREVRQQSRRSR